MVLVVFRSREERMRQRSWICQLEDLQTAEICLSKERWLSKRMPRLRAVAIGWITECVPMRSSGLFSLDSWVELPKIRNSVLEGLRERRLADIQVET
mgnify:CR=1 FL=1